MKRFLPASRKFLSFLLTFIIVFSLFSDVMVVNAAAEVDDMRYVRIKQTDVINPVDTLYIYGSGFTEPAVKAGGTGAIPVKINETLSTEFMLVIDDQDDLRDIIIGKPNIIKVYNEGVEVTAGGLPFDLSSIPLVTSISKSKAYVGESLIIDGNQFEGLVPGTDKLYVSGTEYNLVNGADADNNTADIIGNSINIAAVKSPNDYGIADVKITRYVGTAPNVYEITSILRDSITVVSKISGIEIERIDPNSGPRDKNNIISIYGSSPEKSNFRSGMRIFVESSEGTNLDTIKDNAGNVIGIQFELPTRATSGTVDLVITTNDLSSDFVIPAGFVYLDIGNSLTIDTDGINPNFKKETEQKIIQMKGRNIGFFNGTGYDKLINVAKAADFFYKYDKYKSYSMFNNSTYYKLRYTGVYQSPAGNVDVTIIRQFRAMIDGDATVIDTVYGETDYTPLFGLSKDTIYLKPVDVNLDPNEPKNVDVSLETITTVLDEASGNVIYNRTEEYVMKNGFTYYPNEVSPSITSITPGYGPSNKEIYMTITGKEFQVLENPNSPGQFLMPEVWVDNTKGTNVKVYDDKNKVADGRIITLGTKLKFVLPADLTPVNGAVNVVVINPSGGQKTLANGFQYRNPSPSRIVKISSVKNDYADLRGGVISGETVTITGENFDTSADVNPRVIITIDGEKATVMGKVSSDGKSVVIIPPPGTVAGKTKLQLINEDGSMASADFEYKLVTSNPKITSIVPLKGGKGTKLVIKGEDFILSDNTVEYNDPKRKGSVVLLGGLELNAYKYNSVGEITDDGTNSIYYDGTYDPDGNPLTDNSYTLNGEMVKVQDITTIYVDIPDRYYSFIGGASPAAPYLKSDQVPLGLLKVEVLNPDGARSKENITFNYMNPSTSPVITGIAPNSGSVSGGTVVTITGSGFKQANLEVYFGSEKSETVELINSTMIRATVPDYPYTLPSGQDYLDVPVMVMNYDGGAAVSDNGFRYRVPASNPVITSITPDKGSSAGNDRVVIQGLDFRRTPDMAPSGLPKVYFNGQEATVEWPAGNTSTITESLTVIIPPSLTSGPAEVILVNYDFGTFIYNGFSYIMSVPAIESVMPDLINKSGNVNLQINGSGFREGNLSKLFSNVVERVDRNVTSAVYAEDAIETIVTLGDEDTGDKKMVDTVLGPMYTEIGDLRFDVTKLSGATEMVQVRISLAEDNTHSTISRYRMENGVKTFDSLAQADMPVGSSHLFIINHNMDLNKPNVYDEGILVETASSSVTITRRIAPAANVEYDGTKLTVKAPPTDKIGVRNLYVINDDGGLADGEITIMNPDSSPVITSIDPKNRARERDGNQIVDYVPENIAYYSELFTFVPLDGGAFLTISGADFRRNVKVYLDDEPLKIVSRSVNDDQLVIKVPPGTEADIGKDLRIVIVNEDGGTYDSSMLTRPHYIRYQTQESSPVIESIIPDKSSSRGSNRIAIYGNNFRAGVKVYIEGVEAATTRDSFKPSELLSVLVPTGLEPGKKTVQVQNPDFGFVEVIDGLTIVSSPEITGIFDDKGVEMNPLVLSIEGGEKIKLEGIQLLEGARVIFGGTLKAKSQLAAGESGLEGLNINNAEMVVIGGTLATGVTLQADGSILLTTPKLSMGKTGVIVINSDGGISNEITGEYQKPMPDKPTGIKVEVVDGDTFKLEWDKLEGANYYEIYVSFSEDGKSTTGSIYKYFGSIVPAKISETRLRYYLDGLMPSTWYSIKIRSVNLFGASEYSTSTGYYKTLDDKAVTFYQDAAANIGVVEQNDSTIVNGTELTYTLGGKSLSSSTESVVNFEQPSFIIANPKIMKVSYELINKYPDGRIKINDRDMELILKASNLAVDEVLKVSSSFKDDTDMRVLINRSLGAEGDDIRIKMPSGYKIMINPFSINLSMQVQNTTTRIKAFNGDISLMLKYAESKKSLYPGGIFIAYYDKTSGRIQIINTLDVSGKAQSQISKTGEYVLVGKLIK
ncbi:MAG: IPT/TIG domain-containing protein [Clostridia bacterium]